MAEDSPERDRLWYTWVKEMLEVGLEMFPKASNLHLLSSYIHQEKLNNRFKALYELYIIEENKPSIQD